ncbi:MAG: PAS domain S-box protein [Gemmatimonadota bacterium]|nr:PAS domain S-box protein [Gemmatimonadota bacterium]
MTDKTVGKSGAHHEVADLRQRVQELEAEVAELQRTRALLREEHSFRRGVIERAAEGICVCHAVDEHPFVRFTVWNRRMEELTGYSIDEINRRGWYQSVYPDPETQEQARERMARMRHGDDLRSERWEITCADGSTKTIGISTSLLNTEDGLTHTLALMLDVTTEELSRRRLENRLAHLEGILPICASCKQIRDEDGTWHAIESYITAHSDAAFSHGLCSACATKLYPDVPAEESSSSSSV